jgi:hypothetical protein
MKMADTEDRKNETPEATPKDHVTPGTDSPAVGEARCPLCGGPTKRGWSDVPVLNLATFIIFLALACVAFVTGVGGGWVVLTIASLLFAAIALLSLWALPVTAAMAVAAQPRCRCCGRLHLPGLDGTRASSSMTFPLRYALTGSLILLVLLILGLAWFRSAPGQETGKVGLTFASRIVMAGFALGLGVLAQAMMWRRLRPRMESVAWRSLLLLPAAVLGVGWLALAGYDHRALSRKYEPIKRSPVVLNRAGLAPLPDSARDVRVHAWGFMLSGKYTLRFTADPNDIERFLAASPSLERVIARTYSRERMRLRGGDYVGLSNRYNAQGNECFTPERDVPGWYRQEIRGPGRRYEINSYGGKYQGELLVDDEEHTVYIHVDRY